MRSRSSSNVLDQGIPRRAATLPDKDVQCVDPPRSPASLAEGGHCHPDPKEVRPRPIRRQELPPYLQPTVYVKGCREGGPRSALRSPVRQ